MLTKLFLFFSMMATMTNAFFFRNYFNSKHGLGAHKPVVHHHHHHHHHKRNYGLRGNKFVPKPAQKSGPKFAQKSVPKPAQKAAGLGLLFSLGSLLGRSGAPHH